MSIIDTIKPPGVQQKGATVAELCSDLRGVLDEIARLNDKAGELKQAIIRECGVREEGEQSFYIEHADGRQFRVKTRQDFSRLVDPEQARNLSENLPAQVFDDCFSYKPSLKMHGYRAIADTNPDLRRLLDTAITSRPLPPRCTVEVINNEDTEVQP
jgi:hypothetical protein